MRSCANCGRTIPDNSKVCPYCGIAIDPNTSPLIPKKKDKTAVIIAVVVAVIIIIPIMISAAVYVYVSGMMGPSGSTYQTPTIMFTPDIEQHALTVTHVDSNNYYFWSNIEIDEERGNATLPTGRITVGDVITDCEGTIELTFTPTYDVVYTYTFE